MIKPNDQIDSTAWSFIIKNSICLIFYVENVSWLFIGAFLSRPQHVSFHVRGVYGALTSIPIQKLFCVNQIYHLCPFRYFKKALIFYWHVPLPTLLRIFLRRHSLPPYLVKVVWLFYILHSNYVKCKMTGDISLS